MQRNDEPCVKLGGQDERGPLVQFIYSQQVCWAIDLSVSFSVWGLQFTPIYSSLYDWAPLETALTVDITS